MTTQRTRVGREVEKALEEVLAHVRGETPLPCRIVDDPAAEHIVALRKRMKLSRRKFADRFGFGRPCGFRTGNRADGSPTARRASC